MRSVSVLGALRQMASRIGDPEDVMYGDVSALTADMSRCVLEAAAESEVERRLGFRLNERATSSRKRTDYRNGYRDRVVQLPLSAVTIRLPRLRVGGFVPGFLVRRERAVQQVEDWVYHVALCGVSRSELCRVLEGMTGFVPSPKLLARVDADLDVEVKRFKERSLPDKYRYLFLDAAWVKDLIGRSVGRVCVLTAVGVTADGRKEVLGFERARQESASSWRGFLTRLVRRGLDARELSLVISDEHKGLLEAVPEVLGDVAHQLCWAHRARNVRDAVAVSDRSSVSKGLRSIYRSENMRCADTALRQFHQRWHDLYPGLSDKLVGDARYLLAAFQAPEEHREYVRTTNPIERTFREIRRWRRGCGAFANAKACDRVFYKVSRLLNERWSDQDLFFQRRRAAKADRAKHADASRSDDATHLVGVGVIRAGAPSE